MPVLLLARGDADSKNLLRRAIEARYGVSPPALETLKLSFTGRRRVNAGLFGATLPAQGEAIFQFPNAVRWDYTARLLGIPISSGADSFDGAVCRQRRGGTVTDWRDDQRVNAARACVAALNAAFLTPLAEEHIELRAVGSAALDVADAANNTHIRLVFNDDCTLNAITSDCYNPASGRHQCFTVRFTAGQAMVGALMLPREIAISWDDEALVTLAPTAAQSNPPLDTAVFRLENR